MLKKKSLIYNKIQEYEPNSSELDNGGLLNAK